MEEKQLIIEETDIGERIDAFVAKALELSRSQAKKMIEEGDVLLLGKPCKVSGKVKKTDVFIAKVHPPKSLEVPAEDIEFDIVYQDDMLAVINKPQGLIVHPTTHDLSGTLVNGLLKRLSDLSGINGVLRPGIVHRIDKDTSGLLVVAKCDIAHGSLAKQIEKKTAKRIYLALCEGVFKKTEDVIETKIGRSKTDRKKMAVTYDGKIAITKYEVLHQFDAHALVKFSLETGRTHQIRVHARHIGHPVVGDKTYGFEKQKFKLEGQLLHASKLVLKHPESKEEMAFFAPLPEYFVNVLQTLARVQGVDIDFSKIVETL
ncbi:MAG: RluA family pseudouridine synthase [Bacillota bacterium]